MAALPSLQSLQSVIRSYTTSYRSTGTISVTVQVSIEELSIVAIGIVNHITYRSTIASRNRYSTGVDRVTETITIHIGIVSHEYQTVIS
jgi:hypothetical protein